MTLTRSVGLVLLLVCLLVAGWAFGVDLAIAHMPIGDLIMEARSPEGQYSLSFYSSSTGGCRNNPLVIGRLTDKTSNTTRVFYIEPCEDRLDILWPKQHFVSVNGTEIDLRKDTHDYRAAFRSMW